MDGNRIAWARWPERDGGESGGWSIEVYDIETGNITAAVERFEAMPRDLALLDNDMLAFTADLDVGTPGYEVFVADLE
jgi:hypothetical protein